MYRVLLACAILAFGLGQPHPASAGVKILRVHAYAHATKHSTARHRHRRPRIVAFRVPRCHAKTRHNVLRLTCPRIAWAGSAPRQPWSYEVFRTKARWHQQAALWQTHIRPSPTNATIYWGY